MNLPINIDVRIEIPQDHVYLFGYYVVNGQKSDFNPVNELMTMAAMKTYRENLKVYHFGIITDPDEKKRSTDDINMIYRLPKPINP